MNPQSNSEVKEDRSKLYPPVTLKKRKLLVLGGGGYNPTNTARTFLLCTAAACEGARPRIMNELPSDIPKHEYFARYGPSFELYSKEIMLLIDNQLKEDINKKQTMKHQNNIERSGEYNKTIKEGIEAINLLETFLGKKPWRKKNVIGIFGSQDTDEDFDSLLSMKKSKKQRRYLRTHRER